MPWGLANSVSTTEMTAASYIQALELQARSKAIDRGMRWDLRKAQLRGLLCSLLGHRRIARRVSTGTHHSGCRRCFAGSYISR